MGKNAQCNFIGFVIAVSFVISMDCRNYLDFFFFKELLPNLDEVVLPLFCYLSHCTSYSQKYMSQSMFVSGCMYLSQNAEEQRYSAEIESYFTIFSERQPTLPRM